MPHIHFRNKPNRNKLKSASRLGLYFLLAAILMMVSAASWSERLVDLYEYSVVVESQKQSELRQAIRGGLAEVLVRAVGQANILDDASVMSELRKAEDYYLSYAYEDAVAPDSDDGAVPNNGPAWRLVIKYSGSKVQNLLRDLQLPFWPPRRPNTLVWLVVDQGSAGRQFASPAQMPDILQAVNSSASRRGLPLDFPLLDLEDQVALPPDRLWSLDERQIWSASVRYNPDSVLVGRLTQTSSGEWQSAWTLFHKDQNEVFDSRNPEVETVIATILDQVADYYFSQYGVAPGSGGNIVVDVGGVDGFAEYVDVLNYVESLAIVREVDLIEVYKDRLLLNVYTAGQRKLFEDTLSLGDKLKVDTSLTTDLNPNIDVLRLYLN